jgi:Uma2 family endonuclease
MTVEVDDCGPPIPDEAIAAPNPIVVIEVLSPGSVRLDAGGKLGDYFRVPSIQDYLLVQPLRREIVHHRRAGDRIEATVLRDGGVDLTAPGVCLSLDEVYRA